MDGSFEYFVIEIISHEETSLFSKIHFALFNLLLCNVL